VELVGVEVGGGGGRGGRRYRLLGELVLEGVGVIERFLIGRYEQST